jgi:hypothetical protein
MQMADRKDGSRRDVLRSVGAGVAGLAAVPTVSSATPQQRRDVVQLDASQRILAELNEPTITDAKRSSVAVTGQSGKMRVISTQIETEIGTLHHLDTGQGPEVVQFRLESRYDRDVNDHPVPSRYQEIPRDTDGILILDGDNTMEEIGFLREVSAREHELVSERVQTAESETTVLYNSSLGADGAYEVHVGPDVVGTPVSEREESYLVETRVPPYKTGDVSSAVEDAAVSTLDESDIRPLLNECEKYVKDCLAHTTACAACAGTCATVGVGAIPMALVCISCMWGCSFTMPYFCGKALDVC